MKQLLLIILFFLPFTINSQQDSITISYNKALSIQHKTENLKDQIKKLLEIKIKQDYIVKDLIKKDSLNYKEIEKYNTMDSIMREKNYLSNDIINNYKILLLSSNDSLIAEEKAKRREKMWKNIYKYSYPTLIIAAAIKIFILK